MLGSPLCALLGLPASLDSIRFGRIRIIADFMTAVPGIEFDVS